MGILQTWNDILESIGTSAGLAYTKSYYYQQLNEPIVGVICNLWSKYPRGIPFNPYARSFVNSVCAQAGQPVATTIPAPFQGGQCEGVRYTITVVASTQFNGNPRDDRTDVHVTRGPIEDIYITKPITGNDPRILGWQINGKNEDGTPRPFGLPIGGVGWTAQEISIDIERTDGEPDTCGNLTEDFPPNPVRDTNDFNKTVNIDYIDEGDNVIGSQDLNLNVDINSDLNIPINIQVGGVNLIVDIDGISTPDESLEPIPDGGSEAVPLPGDDSLEEIIGEEEEAEEKDFENRLIWVEIDISQTPTNINNQWGGGSPDLYFLGWFEFKIGDYYLPREFLQFKKSIFLAPENATGYAYTLYLGVKGTAKAYVQKTEINPDEEPIVPEN